MDQMTKLTAMRKSKLVTVCSTDNDGFAPMYPNFTYKGGSRSGKMQVEVSFPSYRENIMFYEHFEVLNDVSPSRLSFMYLGGNDMGEVNYDFQQYQNVTTVDVTYQFDKVNSIFHIISQLPRCSELRIYLSPNNARSPKDEQLFMENVFNINNTFDERRQYTSETIRALKIVELEEFPPEYWDDPAQTRLFSILTYAFRFFPRLECFVVEGIHGDNKGRLYDLLSKFCGMMKNMPKHNYKLVNGKTSCHPSINVPAPVIAKPSPISPLMNPAGYSSNDNPKNISKSETIFSGMTASQAFPATYTDPRTLKRKFTNDLKLETIVSPKSKSKDPEILEVPPPPKMDPITINLSDEDENCESLPKQMKVNSFTPGPAPSPQPSVCSNASTSASSSATTIKMDEANSLSTIGAVYNSKWEDDSDEDDDERHDSKTVKLDPVMLAKVTEDIVSTNDLRSILNNVYATNRDPPRKNNSSRSRKNIYSGLEGVHFERRRQAD